MINTNSFQNSAVKMLNKVPEITIFFWLIKVMCTTVGETAADFLNVNLNFGLIGTSIVTGILLAVALFFQLRSKKYIPITYWLTVMLVSVFGTLVTDNLTDRLGVPLETSTIVFSVILSATFLVWYLKEKTLSIHSIFTTGREIFYWLTILFTFALGTASGDLMAEGLGLGYVTTGIIIAGLIAIFVIGWKWKLNPILSFWLVYILTRPLGASIGDYLSQNKEHGGLGLGATITSFIFVAGILGIVGYLSFSKKDVIGQKEIVEQQGHKGGLIQTIGIVSLLVIIGVFGYHIRQAQLNSGSNIVGDKNVSSNVSGFGDLSVFKTITQDTLTLVNKHDLAGAKTRVADLEYEWDNAQARLKPKDKTKWTLIDGKIDRVLRELRAVNPTEDSSKTALSELLGVLN